MSPSSPSPAARRRTATPTETEVLAAKRILSRAERQGVEEAEKLCRDARRMLDVAAVDIEHRRAEAERVLAESRVEAQRILAEAQRVLAESQAEADRARAVTPEDHGLASAPDIASARPKLGDDVVRRRREAALSAVEPSSDDVGVLRRLLGEDLSADVRLAAVEALARALEPDQLSALGVAMADPDHRVRAGALTTLPVTLTSRAASHVLAASDDPHPEVRTAAYRRLAGAPSWVLWMALGRCSHRSELLGIAKEVAADRLLALVLERVCSPDAGDRVLALEVTGHLGSPALLAEAIRTLVDPDATVRRTAAAQLTGRDPAVPGLVAALQDDPDPVVRKEAAKALAEVGTAPALLGFLGALQDPVADIRSLAVEALRRHPSAGLASGLIAELTSSNLDSVGEVLLGLGPHGEQALRAATVEGPPDRASAATELLKRIGTTKWLGAPEPPDHEW